MRRYPRRPLRGRPAARLGRKAKKVQTVLGEHQDSVLARTLLRRLATTETRLTEARRRVHRLRTRLAEVREKLGSLLRERYMGDKPVFVTVVPARTAKSST